MVYGLPAHGEADWDTKLDASIEAVKATADTAAAAPLPPGGFATGPVKSTVNNLVAYPTSGNSVTLHTLTGAGIIRSLQMTYGDSAMARQLHLQVFVDGEAEPSIDVEWGTLVSAQADAFNAGAMITCRHVSLSSTSGTYAGTCSGTLLFPIPFANGAVVKIYNPGVSTSGMTNAMYGACQYQSGAVSGITDRWRLRSASRDYRTPLAGTQAVSLPLFDYPHAAGNMVFYANAITGASNYSFLERAFNLYRDGEGTPSYRGNSEDWWGSGFYFGGMNRYSSPVAMVSAANNANRTFYGGIDLLEMCGGFSFTNELKMAFGTSAEIKGSNFETTDFTIGFAALFYVDTTSPFVPTAPTIGSAAGASTTSATVTWTAPASPGSQPITGYTVTASPGGATASVAAGVFTATVTGLTTGQAYTFTVHATNSVGNSAESAASNSATPSSNMVPGQPTGLSVTPGGNQNVLNWTAPASNGGSAITNYKVYRATTSGAETLLTTVGNVLTYTDTGAAGGTTYYYKVSAVNAVGEGSQSSEASGTPTLSITDNFTGADSTTSLNGRTTTTGSKTWVTTDTSNSAQNGGISTNRAYFPSIAAASSAFAYVDAGASDCTIQVDLISPTNAGVAFRFVDGGNNFGCATTECGRRVNGTYVTMCTFSSAFQNGDTMKVVLSGSTVTIYQTRSGTTTQVGTFTDSNHLTATKHGITQYVADTTARFDNFSITT